MKLLLFYSAPSMSNCKVVSKHTLLRAFFVEKELKNDKPRDDRAKSSSNYQDGILFRKTINTPKGIRNRKQNKIRKR